MQMNLSKTSGMQSTIMKMHNTHATVGGSIVNPTDTYLVPTVKKTDVPTF